MMHVAPFERGRFLVQSESNPDSSYLVDLLEYRRMGQCSCVDFGSRIQPVWESGDKPDKVNCKHIRRCVSFLAKLVQSLVTFKLNKSEREYAVKKILFRLAAFESKCQLNPQRYGAQLCQ